MASIVGEMKEVPLFKLGELDAEAMRFLMSDFCVRFIDGQGKPVRNLSIHVK